MTNHELPYRPTQEEAAARVAEIQDIIDSARIEVSKLPVPQQEAYRHAFEAAESEGEYIMRGGPGSQ